MRLGQRVDHSLNLPLNSSCVVLLVFDDGFEAPN